MTIDVRKDGSVTILDISGKITINDTEELRSSFEALVKEGGAQFIFDLLDVPWLDSAGIGQTIGCYRRAKEAGGTVKLVVKGKTHDLYTFMELHRVFEMFEDLDTAMNSFSD